MFLELPFIGEKIYTECFTREQDSATYLYVRSQHFKAKHTDLLKFEMNDSIALFQSTRALNYRQVLLNTRYKMLEPICLQDENMVVYIYDNELNLVEVKDDLGEPLGFRFSMGQESFEEYICWAYQNSLTFTDRYLSTLGTYTSEYLEINSATRVSFMEDQEGSISTVAIKDDQGRIQVLSWNENSLYRFRFVLYALIFVLFVLFFLTIIWIQYIIRDRRQLTLLRISSLQLESIQNQLQPHFTFNVLNNIGALINRGENELGYKYLNDFSDMLRVVLASSGETNWSIGNELSFIESYLRMENLRYTDKFHHRISVSDPELYSRKTPKLMVQSFVENSIKHGLVHKDGHCRLYIEIEMQTEHTRVVVEDNGIGRKQAAEISRQGSGRGLQILKRYINVYNRNYRTRFSIKITDLNGDNGESSGTRIEILIPADLR